MNEIIKSSEKVFENHDLLKIMRDLAHKKANEMLSELKIDDKHPKYSSIRYGLCYDIYQSLKTHLNIQSEY